MVTNLGISCVIFETDNQELHSICKKLQGSWQIYPIMKEIEVLKKKIDIPIYSCCRRESNVVADEVARLCKSFSLPRHWTSLPPASLHQKIIKDRAPGVTVSQSLFRSM